jgi:hypothetical protein
MAFLPTAFVLNLYDSCIMSNAYFSFANEYLQIEMLNIRSALTRDEPYAVSLTL